MVNCQTDAIEPHLF